MVLSCWCGQPTHADYTNHQGGSNESITLVLGYSGAFRPGNFIGHKQLAYGRNPESQGVAQETRTRKWDL
jgi:hypothetical protein